MVHAGGFDEPAVGTSRLGGDSPAINTRDPQFPSFDNRFRRQRLWRALSRSLLGLAFIVVLFWVWQRWHAGSEWSRPLSVAGPSMSPTLWENSRQLVCPDCGYQCRVHEEIRLAPHETSDADQLCFRCGNRNASIATPRRAADRIQIDFNAYPPAAWNRPDSSAPQRYDLVAIKKMDGAWEVKRVIALPGEMMVINKLGQIEINGARNAPPLETLWHHRVVVYDDAERTDHLSRWIDDPMTQWTIYHHVDIYNANQPAPIRDDNPANINERRQLERIEELWLLLTFTLSTDGVLEVAFLVDQEREKPRVLHGQVSLTAGKHSLRLTNYGGKIWLLKEPSLASEQGSTSELRLNATDELPHLSATHPVAYRIRGKDETNVTERWLGRHQRYDPPYAVRDFWRTGMIVPTDHVVVLGDNPARSHDSRQDQSAIPYDRILGRVRAVEKTPAQTANPNVVR